MSSKLFLSAFIGFVAPAALAGYEQSQQQVTTEIPGQNQVEDEMQSLLMNIPKQCFSAQQDQQVYALNSVRYEAAAELYMLLDLPEFVYNAPDGTVMTVKENCFTRCLRVKRPDWITLNYRCDMLAPATVGNEAMSISGNDVEQGIYRFLKKSPGEYIVTSSHLSCAPGVEGVRNAQCVFTGQ